MTHRIGIIGALPGELKPLVRGWLQQPDGTLLMQRGEVAVIAAAKGMGAARAEQAIAAAETYGRLDALISFGWAGGASCGVQPGTAYEVGEVIDQKTGERYATAAAANPIKLVTIDHVADREEKRRLAETYLASLVDMEAATVARLAQERQIPFYCWKAVTDIATEDLPDFNQFLDADGQLRTGQLAKYVLTRPQYAAALLRIGRNSKSGAEALAETLLSWIEKGKYANSNR